MIRHLTLTVAVGCCGFAAAAQTMSRPMDHEVAQQIRELEQAWVVAEKEHDATTLRSILDEKFVATLGTEKLYDKASFITMLMNRAVDPTESQSFSNQTLVVDGDTAISIGTDTIRWTEAGKPHSGTFRYTVTYIRRSGRWMALSEHMVSLPTQK